MMVKYFEHPRAPDDLSREVPVNMRLHNGWTAKQALYRPNVELVLVGLESDAGQKAYTPLRLSFEGASTFTQQTVEPALRGVSIPMVNALSHIVERAVTSDMARAAKRNL